MFEMIWKRIAGAMLAAFMAVVPATANAGDVIAHRGVFHDVTSSQNIAENSYYAVVRAFDLGMRGVELDLRLDGQNDLLVVHDFISNRATLSDNANGLLNPIDVKLGFESAPAPIHYAAHDGTYWGNTVLKAYGRNGFIVRNSTTTAHIQSLTSLLNNIRALRPDILRSTNFMIVLDVQDPLILRLAADAVKKFGVQNQVYLKFFAAKALYNTATYRYNGSDTCYIYAKNNNLSGLNVIPQINDGELDIVENNDAGIHAFQTTLGIDQYLQCWADAQAQHADAARMPIVSASVPADNWNATKGAFRAIYWAQSHGRKTMTIIPNPDAGRMVNGQCRLFTFQSTVVPATDFNDAARRAKTFFANDTSVRPDFIVWDVMGDVGKHTYYTDFNTFIANLC